MMQDVTVIVRMPSALARELDAMAAGSTRSAVLRAVLRDAAARHVRDAAAIKLVRDARATDGGGRAS